MGLKIILEAYARWLNTHTDTPQWDDCLARLTEAEDALDAGDEEPAKLLVHDLSVDGTYAQLDFAEPKSAYTAQEREWLNERRPPTRGQAISTPPGQ